MTVMEVPAGGGGGGTSGKGSPSGTIGPSTVQAGPVSSNVAEKLDGSATTPSQVAVAVAFWAPVGTTS